MTKATSNRPALSNKRKREKSIKNQYHDETLNWRAKKGNNVSGQPPGKGHLLCVLLLLYTFFFFVFFVKSLLCRLRPLRHSPALKRPYSLRPFFFYLELFSFFSFQSTLVFMFYVLLFILSL